MGYVCPSALPGDRDPVGARCSCGRSSCRMPSPAPHHQGFPIPPLRCLVSCPLSEGLHLWQLTCSLTFLLGPWWARSCSWSAVGHLALEQTMSEFCTPASHPQPRTPRSLSLRSTSRDPLQLGQLCPQGEVKALQSDPQVAEGPGLPFRSWAMVGGSTVVPLWGEVPTEQKCMC